MTHPSNTTNRCAQRHRNQKSKQMKLGILAMAMSISLVYCQQPVNENVTHHTNMEQTEIAVFASGCFWGTEYYMQKAPGVLATRVGYTGGHVKNPSYKEVCTGRTGHYEAIEIVFDPSKITYEDLAKLFFETHDPTQSNGQGPDIGPQYRSAIFYQSEAQKTVAERLVKILEDKGYKIATALLPAAVFYGAEDYHQNYYENKGGTPYCHKYTQRF
jgi:peptide methionine sulfoxide reductase msrA/msrB